MRKSFAELEARTKIEITDEEREVARAAKKNFKKAIGKMNLALETITDLRNAILSQRPSKAELDLKYRGRLIRYRKKIRDYFNDFLSFTKTSLESLEGVLDPEMSRLRDILVAEIEEFSDGAEAVLALLGETKKDGFTERLELISAQMEKRKKSIIEVIDNQLYGHINQDILGKMKISGLRFKIQKRSRLVKLLARSGNVC